MEADIIGMDLAARACFDPAAGKHVFTRLGEIEKRMGADRMPSLLRTHPVRTGTYTCSQLGMCLCHGIILVPAQGEVLRVIAVPEQLLMLAILCLGDGGLQLILVHLPMRALQGFDPHTTLHRVLCRRCRRSAWRRSRSTYRRRSHGMKGRAALSGVSPPSASSAPGNDRHTMHRARCAQRRQHAAAADELNASCNGCLIVHSALCALLAYLLVHRSLA